MKAQIKLTKTVSFTKTIDLDSLVEKFSEAIDGYLDCPEADEEESMVSVEIESTDDANVKLI